MQLPRKAVSDTAIDRALKFYNLYRRAKVANKTNEELTASPPELSSGSDYEL